MPGSLEEATLGILSSTRRGDVSAGGIQERRGLGGDPTSCNAPQRSTEDYTRTVHPDGGISRRLWAARPFDVRIQTRPVRIQQCS
ncbi:hypothetical protein KM043_009244 [Ampulex compressa]|nr:hypothetical protein KM043_009244 [Ampulex compressa]